MPRNDEKKTRSRLKLGLPGGRMESGVLRLLSDAGISVIPTARSYRPAVSLPDADTKIMKPQNLVEALANGSRDVGFAGADWVEEKRANVVELLDTGLDPVRVVAAAPPGLLQRGRLPGTKIRIATEYVSVTSCWIVRSDLDASVFRSYGRTEVFPPEDADLIVDNTATGSTLEANGLAIVDTILESSTRLYASPSALDDPERRTRIENVGLLLSSVIEARKRVMLEVNAPCERLDSIVSLLPSMRKATVSHLFGDSGFAVKAAVPVDSLPGLIPRVKAAGGTDLVVTQLSQIVP